MPIVGWAQNRDVGFFEVPLGGSEYGLRLGNGSLFLFPMASPDASSSISYSLLLQFPQASFTRVWPQVLGFGVWATAIALLQTVGVALPLHPLGSLVENVVCNLVLGLLLVFRTNTAYDRFWEGRKAWGAIVVNIRSLAREIQVGIAGHSLEKQRALKYLVAFVLTTKLHLRYHPALATSPADFGSELKEWLTPTELTALQTAPTPPLEILLWLGICIQHLYDDHACDSNQRWTLNDQVNELVGGLTSCERILTTPIPPAYAFCLQGITAIYSLLLPFAAVEKLGLWTVLLTVLVTWILWGVEAIANEIENPFGTDANDLPIDEICQGAQTLIEYWLNENLVDR